MNQLFSNEINQLEYKIQVKGETVTPVTLPVAKIVVGSNKDLLSNETTLDVTEVDDVYKVAVPSSLLQNKRFARVTFEYQLAGYGVIKEQELHEITRRLLSFDEVNKYRGEDSTGESFALSYADYDIAESIVRLVIEEYCNTKFNLWQGTQTIYGSVDAVHTSQYLSKLDSLSSALDLIEYYNNYDLLEYKISDSGLYLSRRQDWQKSTVYSKNQPKNSYFNITGTWGYESVPRPVKEAALELLRFFVSDDIEARRKFFLNVNSSSNNSYTFNFSSYRDSTGNPIADALLSPYRIFMISAV